MLRLLYKVSTRVVCVVVFGFLVPLLYGFLYIMSASAEIQKNFIMSVKSPTACFLMAPISFGMQLKRLLRGMYVRDEWFRGTEA